VATQQHELCFCIGTALLYLRPSKRALNFFHWGWVGFLRHSIFEPGKPQRVNACGFLRRCFEMIFEIITAIFLVQGCSILSQLIERRRDVLYYVSKPDPRRQNRRRVYRLGKPRASAARSSSAAYRAKSAEGKLRHPHFKGTREDQ
jgi:hypothetical protein